MGNSKKLDTKTIFCIKIYKNPRIFDSDIPIGIFLVKLAMNHFFRQCKLICVLKPFFSFSGHRCVRGLLLLHGEVQAPDGPGGRQHERQRQR